ncbi:hypothetical protein ACFQ08_07515 [Streptosporangium algeriense]|uniref:Uncharacterized protein n=1 Tax=Streptosporangium algeriense TaxID=1682748 RepID=A0ABW3DKG8_9ACTN
MTRAIVSWTFGTEGRPIRKLAAAGKDSDQHLKLAKAHDTQVRNRLLVSLSAAVVLPLGTVLIAETAPTYGRWGLLAGLVGMLGLIGTPADRQVFDR